MHRHKHHPNFHRYRPFLCITSPKPADLLQWVMFWFVRAYTQQLYAYMIVGWRSSGMGESQQVGAVQTSWSRLKKEGKRERKGTIKPSVFMTT